ncbi:unnamed protein product [Leuciscus chuanchicus]
MAKAHAVGMIDALYDNFLNRLKGLSPSDSSRPTIMKNDLGNLTKLNVLHCDQRFILELFQSSINDEVVGQRGTLFPIYTMTETANFQSNLDHLPMDVDQRLLSTMYAGHAKLNFIQLYARSTREPGHHDVRHAHRAASPDDQRFRRQAQKTVTDTYARLEGVFLVGPNFDQVLDPRVFFSEPMLNDLLETAPMLVPFRTTDGSGMSSVVHSVATYLTGALRDLLNRVRGSGGYENSWSAFQIELAVEELFFGHPLCRTSLQVSSSRPNSLTRMRGFLCLGPIGSASVGESPPPLDTWTKDGVQKARVLRLFPLTDSLLAGPQIIGEQLVRILLCDMHQRDENLPCESLKGRTCPFGRLVDFRTVSEFAREVVGRKAFGYPLTFGRAVKMVTAASHDPAHCLSLALSGYRFFPNIKYWDEQRHLKAKWNFKDYVELHQPAKIPSAAARAASYVCENR